MYDLRVLFFDILEQEPDPPHRRQFDGPGNPAPTIFKKVLTFLCDHSIIRLYPY